MQMRLNIEKVFPALSNSNQLAVSEYHKSLRATALEVHRGSSHVFPKLII